MIIEYKDIPKALEASSERSFKIDASWTFQITTCAQLEVQSGPGQDRQAHTVTYVIKNICNFENKMHPQINQWNDDMRLLRTCAIL